MRLWLFLLFIGFPILELYLLIKVGGAIGALTTVLLVVLTAFIGASLIKRQGVTLWTKINRELHSGRLPAFALWHSLLLLVAGCLFITPGFITDSIGLLLLVPAFRVYLLRTLVRVYLQRKFSGSVRVLDGEFKIL